MKTISIVTPRFNEEGNIEACYQTIKRLFEPQFRLIFWVLLGAKMKVVILAGGMGSRLSEETIVRPKPLVNKVEDQYFGTS